MTHPTVTEGSVREALLRFYPERGLRVHPCWWIGADGRCACPLPDCREANWGKHPIFAQWQHVATADVAQLLTWHGRYPLANWAWAVDEDRYVLDCDPRNGGPRTEALQEDWARLGLPEAPPTLGALSGSGGTHLVYRTAEGEVSRNGALVRPDGSEVPGINVKGAGGYVLVSPSNHVSGGVYRWREPWLEPVEYPALAGFLTRRAARPGGASGGGSGSLVDPAPGEAFLDKWYREAPSVANGNQRGWLLSGLGWMRKRGRAEVEMYQLGVAVAERFVCYDPAEPWSGVHVAELVRDVSERYEVTRDGDGVIPAWRPYVVTGGADPGANGVAAVVDLQAERDRRGPPPGTDLQHRNTDLQNARTLRAWHGEELLWTPQAGWLHWDEKRWQYDAAQQRHALVARLAGELWQHQDQVPDGQREALQQQSRRLESVGGVEACLKLAEHLHYRDLGDLDQQPELLNCANGTLDLATGALHDWQPGELLTRLCPTEYHEGATSPLLDEYLDTFVPDPDRRTWLWRLLGTCLLGGNPWRLLLFLIGPTTTGKSQLATALQVTLGDYAGVGSASAFRGNLDDRPRPDVLKLLPCRLVVLEETSAHWELHADKLKHLTGEATVSARGMRSDHFVERVPEFTPLFVANEAPTVKGADPAVQRRLLALEFRHRPDREDPSKRRVFLEDRGVREALLARLVEGLRDLRRHGIDDQPAWLTLATMSTFEQMDDVGEFLRSVQEDERLVWTGEGQPLTSYALVGDVHAAYRRWVRDHGDAAQQRDRLGRNKFNERLRSLGFQSVDSGGRRWLGWELRDPAVTWRP